MIILATTSPRRIEIFDRLGFSFKSVPPLFEEASHRVVGRPIDTPLEFAYNKALSISKSCPDDLVLGFDTMLFFKGELIGKPKSIDEAIKFFEKLSGRTHQVITGVSILCKKNNVSCNFTDTSYVSFKTLTKDLILKYFVKVNPLDKAGGYAIQEHADMIIKKSVGSLDNIIGVPTEKVVKELNNIKAFLNEIL